MRRGLKVILPVAVLFVSSCTRMYRPLGDGIAKGIQSVMGSVVQDVKDQIRFSVVLTAYWKETGNYPGSTDEFCTYLESLRLTNEAAFYREWTMTLDDRRCLSVRYTNVIGKLRDFQLCQGADDKCPTNSPAEK